MIRRVRMSTEERQAERWAQELNDIFRSGDPESARASQLGTLLDAYWSDKDDWEEGELEELAA
jgi:hypothetical protein